MSRKSTEQSGFTLIELMIVIVIVAILVSIAVPAYNDQIRKTRRADAKAALMQAQQFLERNYTEANRYDKDAAGAAIVLPITKSPIDGATAYYNISFAAGPASQTYTLQAVPNGAPQNSDPCGTLTITQAGVRGDDLGNPDLCWSR